MATLPPPKLTLVYFDFGGRAEATRLALFLGGIAFEDKRVAHDGFTSDGSATLYPYAQLPVLQVDGMAIGESIAMARYAGRLAGLYPANDPLGCGLIDEVLELVEVFTERNLRWERESDPQQQRELEHELTTTLIPSFFYEIDAKLQQLARHATLASATSTGSTTSTLFIHDLVLRSFVEFIIRPDWETFVPDESKIQHWQMSISKVESHPKVIEYYALQQARKQSQLQQVVTLTDVDSRSARGESIRMALRLGGIPFVDTRVPISETVAVFGSETVASDAEPNAVLKRLPRLEIGEHGHVKISQLFAILRYVGSLTGLYPGSQDPLLSFKVDELLGYIEELQNWWYYPAYTQNDPAKQRAVENHVATTTIPRFLSNLDKRVAAWAAPFATGDSLTIADLAIHGLMTQLQSGWIFPAVHQTEPLKLMLEPYSHLLKIQSLVTNHTVAQR